MQDFNGDVSGSAMNTLSGTVRGKLFGSKANLEKMKLWLLVNQVAMCGILLAIIKTWIYILKTVWVKDPHLV